MLKKNLLLLAELLITIFLCYLIEIVLMLTVFNVGERKVWILVCDYLIMLVFAARCFIVMRKAEHRKHSIGGLILGIVIFINGIYNLIADGSWLNVDFVSSMIFSIAIFSGILLNTKK